MNVVQNQELELDNGLVGFTVTGDGEERIGEVTRTSLDRACLLVASGRTLLGRRKEHAIHRSAIVEIDLDTATIVVRATREQVEAAPEYSDLDVACREKVATHYRRGGSGR